MAFARTEERVYRAAALDQLPGVRHAFGTRHGGTDGAGRRVTLKQIHSDGIVRADGDQEGVLGQGDALISATPGLRLVIRTADCVPVLLADRRRPAVAAIHAGWRGTAAQIAAKTIARMEAEFGSRPEDLVAAIGPAIAACCYEVGPEVAERFVRWQPELLGASGAVKLDLHAVQRKQLAEAGVSEVSIAGLCTRCVAAEFHSYRRDGDRAGRMESWIELEGSL